MNKQETDLFLKAQGARILSELNDLKRTADACADDIGWERDEVKRILDGDCTPRRLQDLMNRIVECYPIDRSEMMLPENDCTHGVKIMRAWQSEESSRTFDRRNRHGQPAPYYEYRDTAMSRLSAFRPEWIKELRVVHDNAPDNPDVVYNNGHFMHQLTYFVGPVNFYYEVNGEKHCVEMNTGDSNYITPFWPHSFASRDENQEAYIIAVTFGGSVKRAQGELYQYGKDRVSGYLVDMRHPERASQDLLDFHLQNEHLTRPLLQEKLLEAGLNINVLDRDRVLTAEELGHLAHFLHIEPGDLQVPPYRPDEEVVIQKHEERAGYLYPSGQNPHYRLYPGSRCHRMPLVKSFNIEVPCDVPAFEPDLSCGLHTYLYNYSDAELDFFWQTDGAVHHEKLAPGDSAYVQPFILHGFRNQSGRNGRLFMVGIPGAVQGETQRELSAFAAFERVVGETKCWFNA